MAETLPPAAPRTGILTFHRCINYGSYWQARCLVNGLRARGMDAVLLDHDSPAVTRLEWRCAFQPALPKRTPRAQLRFYSEKARKLLQAIGSLPLSSPFHIDAPDAMDRLDQVVVGSDEVWNMHHPWYGGKPIFYGVGVETRLTSYAASFGNQDAAEGLHPWWAEQLSKFSSISVRDENSRSMIRNVLGIEAPLVLDPCLQFPPAAEPDAGEAERPYVAVYGHSFPSWYAASIRAWARRRGYRLLSIGYHNEWADEQRIGACPEEFAGLIAGSLAVATNFFHGCVFALLNSKPFACVSSSYRANKIRDLTSLVGAGHHLITEEVDDAALDRLVGLPLSETIPRRIAALRASSQTYLSHALA